MKRLAQKIYEANKRRFAAAEHPLRSHGPDHHLRVYEYAAALAQKLGVDYDDEVLAAAALLHDLAAYYPAETGERYHDFDYELAADVLEEVGFPERKLSAALYAIAHHGSDAKYIDEHEPIEVTLLRDADKLDVFGPIGVARIVMARTLKGDTLAQIVQDFHADGHLERKWRSITSDAARELAHADYEYAKAFFARLAQTLEAV